MNAWKTNDKQWVKARKESWKAIKRVLLKTQALTRDRIKPLQDYYLTGKEPEIIPPPWDDEYFFMIFKLWLHADQSEDNWLKIIRFTEKKDFERSRGIFKYETGTIKKHVDDFGFMGGLEPRFGKLFFPDPVILKYYKSKDITIPLFEKEQFFDPHSFFAQWRMDLSYWLKFHSAPKHHWLEYATHLIWECLPFVDPERLKKGSGLNPYGNLHTILCQCANYVEPRGTTGDDTPQRRFCDYLRKELDERALPPFLKEQWEKVQTRSGRNFWIKIDLTDGDQLTWDDADGYPTFVEHDKICKPHLIPKLIEIFQRLNFTQDSFDPSIALEIDLSKHLTPRMVKRLGYGAGQPIPAYRYRIHTNDKYTDDDNARVYVDLIIPIRNASLVPQPDTPALLWVSRPSGTFCAPGSLPFELNQRMVRRIFALENGFELQRYCNLNFHDRKKLLEFESKDPFYAADYQPMVNFRMPILDRPEDDFPPWKGDPLPKLFG